ncbi:large-conductance mechanosensitive channel protein MscL [Gillisia limnaea]|uniref:Large-conductance mechanosensitive channel n=2 Tax=Gillisia TaxID=244698 RepID=H2C0C7_GILLR|nr:Large-conductance mechanosensitive channel [Gillisia limnaea DSM 15749]
MMGILKEFKEFAIKGNMIDMAVGIIIGTAFNKVIDVLVKQVVLPPLSLLTEGVNFADRKIILREGLVSASDSMAEIQEISIGYGAFVEAMLDFLIVGFTIFMVVKFMNRFRRKSQDPKNKTVETPKDIQLLSDLTELIQEQNELLRKGSANP